MRQKIVENKTIKWTQDEKIHLQTIYQAITKKTLSLNCQACWIGAINIINNYIKYHEPKKSDTALETKVTFIENQKPYEPNDTLTRKEIISLLKERGESIPHNAKRDELLNLLNG